METIKELVDESNTDAIFFGLYILTFVLGELIINVLSLQNYSEIALMSTHLGCF